MNTSLNTFLTEYKTELEASNKRFNDLMFRRALITKIDLTCIDHIIQGIEDDQPRFNKWCEKWQNENRTMRIRFVVFVTSAKQTNH